jgi:transposase, IS5 family
MIYPQATNKKGDIIMGYKQIEANMTFAEASLTRSMENNRSLQRLERINEVIDWEEIECLLKAHYRVGTSKAGAYAYEPLMLLKCLLLQQWYKIESDPELENQINDRVSFKKFLGISFDVSSPDHSTYSRFRSRLSKEAMRIINNAVLRQFANKGLSINEGVAIDARLVQSASHAISKEAIEELRDKGAGSDEVNGRVLKFSRDMESDWTVKNDKPLYGLKEHASVDTRYGFVLASELTSASVNDSIYLPYCVAMSFHTDECIRKVYADKGYHGKPNREFLYINGIEDGIMRRDSCNAKLTEHERERNRQISKKRYIVEQYFGLSHLHNGAQRARFTRLIKNAIDVLFRQMAFNLFRCWRVLGSV